MAAILLPLLLGAVKTVVTRVASSLGNRASKFFEDEKTTAPRETKSKELTALERRYLAEKDKREQIALDIQREQLRLQAKIHTEQIELSLKQIQANFDNDRWVGVLSRDETVDVLRASQEKHHLLMLLSEPEISPSCPDTFKHDLPIAVRNELKQFMQEQYPFSHECYPVQFFGKFFETRVFDTHVKQYERLLNSVPTVVLYSQMTDENLYLHLYGWGFGKTPLTETCVLNWEAIYEQLHSEGSSDKDAYKAIRKIIVALHQAFAAFCSDFYYLTVINPLHEPRLLTATFNAELQAVLEPLTQSLQILRAENQQRYEQQLLQIELQEQDVEFQKQRKLEREKLEREQQKQRELEDAQRWRLLNKFKVRNDGIALDEKTGLMWLRFAMGQIWQNNTAEGEATGMIWDEAMKIAETFNANGGWAGYTDWRLPSPEELKTLLDKERGRSGNYIDAAVFPNNDNGYSRSRFWSTSLGNYGREMFLKYLLNEIPASDRYAQVVYFNDYNWLQQQQQQENRNYVRLVRGGQ